MSTEAWQFLGLVVVQVTGLVALWLKLRKSRQILDDTAENVHRAVELSEPTGNGFAQEVRESLAELKILVQRNYNIASEARQEIRDHKDDHYLATFRKEKKRKKHD